MKNLLEKLKAVPRKAWLISGIALGCAVLILVGCLVLIPGADKTPDTPDVPVTAGTAATVTVKNALDAPIADAQVYVYEDATLTELATFAKTDAEGKAAVTLTGADNVAVLKGTAPGYKVEESYPLDGDTTITLEALASYDTVPTDAKIDAGDPMIDFTFTDMEGNTYVASEVLKEKKALVLNFWFTTCDPCRAEFPYLQTAYDAYKESVALLAVNPYETDDAEKINAFVKENKLTFPVVDADPAWASLMNITAYPTTVVIDRYGFVAFSHVGTVTEEGVFEKLFKYYSAEDYAHTVAYDVSELKLPEEAPKEDEEGLVYDNESEPIEYGGTLTFNAKIPAGKTTYFNIYKVSGTYLNLEAEDVIVKYNDKEYTPENGVISFPVETDDVTIPVKLAITNTGDETAAYTVNFGYPRGSLDNPFDLEMGDFTTKIEKGNETGVVYEYTATANGTVTMYVESVTKGVECGFSLFNKRNSAMRNSDEDATGSKKSVSIAVNKGDVVQVTVSVLPDEKHEYPAATIKSHISFKAGEGTGTTKPVENVTYKVTVKSDKKALSGVKLTFTSGSKSKSVTTNSKGVASAKLPAGTCTVKMTCPKGYIAEKLQYTIDSSKSTSLTINLEKEEGLSTDVGTTPTDYSVKVVNGSGKAQKDITVAFYLGDKKVESAKTNSKGIAKATMMDGSYTVKLSGTTLKYDEKSAYVTVANPSIEILLAKTKGTAKEKITCPVVNASRAAYVVEEGATYLNGLRPGERNYFLFTPDRDGVYRISTTNVYAKVGYYGASIHFIQTANMAENMENNAFTVEVKDVGPSFVIGVDAATNIDATVLLITRVGDPGWSVADEPWYTYEGTHTPKSYKLSSGTTLKNMDITKSYKLVYNSTDGYYHKDSKNGPVVYLRFEGTSYVAFADILNNFHISAYLYDAAGNFQKKEEYTECMQKYYDCVDADEKVYPLTKDLEYILKTYGEHQGWWIPDSPGYLFLDSDGNPVPNVNLDTAWMFPLCYAD